MPHDVVLGAIYSEIKGLLAASGPLTSILSTKPLGGPAIYDEGGVVQAATMPYLTVGAGTQNPFHTMGEPGTPRYGWNCTLQIKAVGQMSESSGLGIMSYVAQTLREGTALSLPGYGSAYTDEFSMQPTIITLLGGVPTREWPAILRVFCHDL